MRAARTRLCAASSDQALCRVNMPTENVRPRCGKNSGCAEGGGSPFEAVLGRAFGILCVSGTQNARSKLQLFWGVRISPVLGGPQWSRDHFDNPRLPEELGLFTVFTLSWRILLIKTPLDIKTPRVHSVAEHEGTRALLPAVFSQPDMTGLEPAPWHIVLAIHSP